MFGVVGETHAHDYFEVISFYNSCYFKCSFKQDKLDFRVQFSFKRIIFSTSRIFREKRSKLSESP